MLLFRVDCRLAPTVTALPIPVTRAPYAAEAAQLWARTGVPIPSLIGKVIAPPANVWSDALHVGGPDLASNSHLGLEGIAQQVEGQVSL